MRPFWKRGILTFPPAILLCVEVPTQAEEYSDDRQKENYPNSYYEEPFPKLLPTYSTIHDLTGSATYLLLYLPTYLPPAFAFPFVPHPLIAHPGTQDACSCAAMPALCRLNPTPGPFCLYPSGTCQPAHPTADHCPGGLYLVSLYAFFFRHLWWGHLPHATTHHPSAFPQRLLPTDSGSPPITTNTYHSGNSDAQPFRHAACLTFYWEALYLPSPCCVLPLPFPDIYYPSCLDGSCTLRFLVLPPPCPVPNPPYH